mmetsp:Transcript_33508/g.58697  ORF Transcript_33508/g.58697 Transcript_33508/m.58697 type:complete len:328 (+) Transcript_33508:36-1019(+)
MNFLVCSVCDNDRCRRCIVFVECIYDLPDEVFDSDVDAKGLVLCEKHSSLFIGAPKSIGVARKYNRHLLRAACKFMGCKLTDTQRISTSIFASVTNAIVSNEADLETRASISSVTMRHSYLLSLACQTLGVLGYSGLQLRDYDIGCNIMARKLSITVLLGGTSGTGKSTLSSLVASRLGISTVLSTDSIRHVMRSMIDPKSIPVLFCSTYEAGKYVDDPSLSEKQASIKGHSLQCNYVYENLAKMIQEFQQRKESVVIEGVHLSVSVMKKLMSEYSSCIPFIVCIKNKAKHRERFAVRSKQMTLDPHLTSTASEPSSQTYWTKLTKL